MSNENEAGIRINLRFYSLAPTHMQKSQDCVELQNPTYLLVLDFRSLEEWLEERLVTSLHHERLQYLERYKGQDNDHLHYNKNDGLAHC